MYYIDPHIHMVSRTTDDYETLTRMGCVAVSEPSFWAGYGKERDQTPESQLRNIFYLLYEIQKYIVIRRMRNRDPARRGFIKPHRWARPAPHLCGPFPNTKRM